jgi:hypothetical protein
MEGIADRTKFGVGVEVGVGVGVGIELVGAEAD